MGFQEDFSLLLRARYPLIYLPTQEEERAEQAIVKSVSQLDNRLVYFGTLSMAIKAIRMTLVLASAIHYKRLNLLSR